ncbi:MAG: hypothetical protein M5U09_10345 [Gammaproteobacteria bacterium]|nr:hypothetical protein [Gammaproteobacteria bacterium]
MGKNLALASEQATTAAMIEWPAPARSTIANWPGSPQIRSVAATAISGANPLTRASEPNPIMVVSRMNAGSDIESPIARANTARRPLNWFLDICSRDCRKRRMIPARPCRVLGTRVSDPISRGPRSLPCTVLAVAVEIRTRLCQYPPPTAGKKPLTAYNPAAVSSRRACSSVG